MKNLIANKFALLKNGNVSTTVWANPSTKEVYPANRNSFGYNALQAPYGSDFYNKYGKDMKVNQCKSNYNQFTYSAKSMQELGFVLVLRGAAPLF